MTRRLLLSTNNLDKVREYQQILEGLPLEIVTPDSLGLKLDVEETGSSFAENAAIKANAFQLVTRVCPTAIGKTDCSFSNWKGYPGRNVIAATWQR